MAYIELKNLDYWYAGEDKKVLSNINLQIEKGEILFIVGRSGSGKSTLAKAITGAVPQFYGGKIRGQVLIKDIPLKDMDYRERAKEITMVFQDPERQLMMNKVHREVAFGLESVGIEEEVIERRVWEAMQFSNILDIAERDISSLSGGQKQRVAITSAIAYLPGCIILDEPTSQLDPSAAEEVIALIKKINEELGTTIIVIEQRIDKWFDIADRMIIMEAGAIKFNGRKEEIYVENYESFYPEYFKLAKRLGYKEPPRSFKHMRSLINSEKIAIESLKNTNKKEEVECINIKKLKVNYGSLQALKNISINIREGELLGIIGSNGAGKSTLLKSIMGLFSYEGSIKLFGKEVKKLKLKEISMLIGYVSQNPNDYITKDTVYDEIKFTLDNHKIKDYALIDQVLLKLGIEHLRNKNPRDLSGGEKQRVAIASVLVTKPKILMLDEPTRGLDYEAKVKLGKLLKELNKEGTTIIMVTHDMEFASKFCSRFILMFNGSIAASGDHHQVLDGGIYFTTSLNKLFRDKQKDVFNISQFVERDAL
ncbi:MAG: ABC transporter ATP-binding protein [Clostridiales bacterium]|uniref:ABC transporter ATP-binding protein n=1 Tax=Clostridium sp. N3C TaxID=1776758 RepID=UPI00092E188E|nr:energy-coupling factor transporter ATPase [Clostridium sp. N3C]NLZ49420.1 ABC transporter ATP-binding protein [Clostridiales bacterium]SCN25205.1 putative HMP/thiamine import ATP-binding protein YkoD [Clostridium sp. N3C]